MERNKEKKKRGGYRPNARAPLKYANGAVRKTISIPKDGVVEIMDFINKIKLKYKLPSKKK